MHLNVRLELSVVFPFTPLSCRPAGCAHTCALAPLPSAGAKAPHALAAPCLGWQLLQ